MKKRYIALVLCMLMCTEHWAQSLRLVPYTGINNRAYTEVANIINYKIDSLKAIQGLTSDEIQKEKIASNINMLQYELNSAAARVDKNGNIMTPHEMNKIYQKEKSNSESSKMSIGSWYQKIATTSSTNYPGIDQFGQSAYVVIDPTNSNVMYSGNYNGGHNYIHKTYDKGATWECITNGISINYNLPLAINPLNNNHLVTSADGQIIVSYDGGTNWYEGQDLNSTQTEITFSPISSNVVLASTYNQGIFRSTDGGITWTNVKFTGSSYSASKVQFLPGTDKCFFAYKDSLFSSNNGGATWTPILNSAFLGGTPNADPSVGDGFFVSNASSSTIYFAAASRSDTLHVFKSTNSGITFSFVNEVYLGNIQNGMGGSFAVSQTDANTMFVLSINSYKSNNGGITWTSLPFSVDYVFDLNVPNSSELYISVRNGLHYSSNAMTSWQNIGLPLQTIGYDVIDGLPNNSNFFVGTNSIFTFSKKWELGDERTLVRNKSCLAVVTNKTNQDVFYLNNAKKLSKTVNRGLSFTDIYSATKSQNGYIRYVKLNPLQNNTIYLGEDTIQNRIYASNNAGASWHTKATLPSNIEIRDIAIAPNDTTRYYAIARDITAMKSAIYASNNSGADGTWVQIAIGNFGSINYIPNGKWITVNTSNKNEFFFAKADSIFKCTWNGIGAATLQFIHLLPNNLSANCMAYQQYGNPGLYIGTTIGVYFLSTTNYQSILLCNGLPLCSVEDIIVHEPLGLISIAVSARGIWQGPLYDACTFNYTHQDGLFQPPVAGAEYFEVSNQITSTKNIYGGAGVQVTYNAGNNVTMNVGFEVKAGSEMHAYIDGCILPSPMPRISLLGQYAGELTADVMLDNTVKEATLDNNTIVSMYPNPAKDAVTFEYNLTQQASVAITLVDISGRTVATFLNETNLEQGHYKQQLPLYNIEPGTYMVYVTINGSKQMYKLVVTHQ